MEFEMNMNEFLPLRDVVFQNLRQAILMGQLKPGERLLEIKLANQLGVSRTPVREAMRKLELEGLVNMIPRRGAVVAEITEQGLRDVLEVRKALEILAVELACERINPEQLEDVKKQSAHFKSVILDGDVTKIAQADVDFHDAIYQATGNERLIQLLNNLREQMYRLRVEYLKEEDYHQQLLVEHEELVGYIEHGDRENASGIIGRHIDNQAKTVRTLLKMS